MNTPLLRTKLYIPHLRPELVARPRLIERLNTGLQRKLTLISAPAGFGKTTLVSEWIDKWSRQYGVRSKGQVSDFPPTPSFSWLSLDENDNDPARFLTYLIAALQTIDVDLGKGVQSALQSPQPPPSEAVLTSLINEIAAISDRILLVLDDYHLIEARAIHDVLAFLLEHLPPNLHLVIATREDPPLPLARLRVRGQLTELRATDLRFTSSEAATFLNRTMGLDLSADDVSALETRTEGWIAGLQLAAISMQGSGDAHSFAESFTGSHHYVLDYLIEEVLHQQPESIQEFLLCTSILTRLTGPLCDAVRGASCRDTASGQQTLEMLERANLFIVPLDNERRWYRYHHLFAELLRQRLRQTQPEQEPALHMRASEWYEQNGFTDEAIEHALRAEDYERGAYLIGKYADAVWRRSEHIKLRRWLVALPSEWVMAKPDLCILDAWNRFIGGQLDAAEQSLQSAERALDLSVDRTSKTTSIKHDQLPGADKTMLRGRVATLRAFLASYRGDVPGIIHYARQALDDLPEQDITWRGTAAMALGDAYGIQGQMAEAYEARIEALATSRSSGDVYFSTVAHLKVAITLRMLGQLQRVIEICQQQWHLANESGMSQTAVIGWLLAIWGEVLAEKNDLDGALQQTQKGVERTEHSGDVAMFGWSHLCLIRTLFSRQNVTGAQEILQKTESVVQKHDVPPFIANQLAAWKARIWLAQDRLDAVSQWVAERRLTIDGKLTLLREMEHIVLARILIVQGQVDQAIRLLQRLYEAAAAGQRTTRTIEILVLQSLAFQASNDAEKALSVLEHALTLAEPGGYSRLFVDEGPPVAQLLMQCYRKGVKTEYVAQLLSAFETGDRASSKSDQPASPLVEPLSEREIEVLQLVAQGLTNPEIASRLFLTRNTVKAHTRNIYGKLGAHNRTQAVAIARALGILSDN